MSDFFHVHHTNWALLVLLVMVVSGEVGAEGETAQASAAVLTIWQPRRDPRALDDESVIVQSMGAVEETGSATSERGAACGVALAGDPIDERVEALDESGTRWGTHGIFVGHL